MSVVVVVVAVLRLDYCSLCCLAKHTRRDVDININQLSLFAFSPSSAHILAQLAHGNRLACKLFECRKSRRVNLLNQRQLQPRR